MVAPSASPRGPGSAAPRDARRATRLLALGGLLICVALCGCSREDRWWRLVTGFPSAPWGFSDRWTVTVYPVAGDERSGEMLARVEDGAHARLDYSLAPDAHSVLYEEGRLLRVSAAGAQEMVVDRTLLLTYLLPFLGRRQLGETLASLGIDTTVVTPEVPWEGRLCIRVGGAEEGAGPVPRAVMHIDAASGAVLQLVTVSNSAQGQRVTEFRLSDHRPRAGAQLPARLEVRHPDGARTLLTQTETRAGVSLDPALFRRP